MPTSREVNTGPDAIGKELVCTLFGRDSEKYVGYLVVFLSRTEDVPIEIATDAPGIGAINWILTHAAAAISDDLVELDSEQVVKQCGICKEIGHTSDEHS